MTQFPNAFSDFVNGLFDDESEEPPAAEPQELTLGDLEDLQRLFFERLRRRIGQVIEEQIHQAQPNWSEQLTPLQLIIRDEILRIALPAPEELEGLTREEVAQHTAFTFMTLGWLIERAMADES